MMMKTYVFVAVNKDKWRKKRKNFCFLKTKCVKTLPMNRKKCYSICEYNSHRKEGGAYMISLQALCNTLLKRSFDENISISPMKLQKLLYFIYRDYYQETGKPLFAEDFEAWQYGPVLRSVYDEFKTYGASRIDSFSKTANGDVYVINERTNSNLKDIIDSVWNKYKNLNGIELSEITHKAGGAWRKAYLGHEITLSDEDIKNDHVQ
jgi:hypothetical protein